MTKERLSASSWVCVRAYGGGGFFLFFNSYYMCFILGKLSRVVEIENGKFQPCAKSGKYVCEQSWMKVVD